MIAELTMTMDEDATRDCRGSHRLSVDTTMMSAKLCSEEVCSVRRCLFERPDADVTRRDLERALGELRRRSSVAWNFDFDGARPLAVAGPIVWTRRDGSDVWVGKLMCDEAARRCTDGIVAASTQSAAVRECPARRRGRQVNRAAAAGRGVMKSSRLTQRRQRRRPARQSRVTGHIHIAHLIADEESAALHSINALGDFTF